MVSVANSRRVRRIWIFLLAAGCASAPKAAETPQTAPTKTAPPPAAVKETPAEKLSLGPRAEAASFSVPIPAGFEEYHHQDHEAVYAGGGVILAQIERPKVPHAFQASILITPLPNKGLDLHDAMLCFSLSEPAAKSLSGAVLGVRKM